MTLERPDRAVRMAPELMDQLFTRDIQGRRLRVDWGKPDADGFYTPTIWSDPEDDLLAAERARALASTQRAEAVIEAARELMEEVHFYPNGKPYYVWTGINEKAWPALRAALDKWEEGR